MGKAPKNELLTAAEASRYLRITSQTLYRYLQRHQVPAFKLGKEWRIVRSDLEEWLRTRVKALRS